MKNKTTIRSGQFLMAFLFGAVLAMASTGCKTVVSTDSSGVASTNRVPDQMAIDLAAGAARSAAYLGTKIYLEGIPPRLAGHPNDRQAFETARASVKTLIAAGTFSSSDLTTRSEEHTSELQSHSFISYAVFCLKKKKETMTDNILCSHDTALRLQSHS